MTDYISWRSSLLSVDQILTHRQAIITNLKHNLHISKQRMAFQANKHRIDCAFQGGDLVLLKLQPYRQTTVQHRVSQKLAKRFFGPFTMHRRIGSMAYELRLPPDLKIHPVFHVSQLRAYHGRDPTGHFVPLPKSLPTTGLLGEESENSPHALENSVPQVIHSPLAEPPQSTSVIPPTTAPASDLEDKVPSDPVSNDSKLEQPGPKRQTHKPFWLKDFHF